MKKVFVSVLLLCMSLIVFPFHMMGQEVYVYSNADDGFLNVREKPSASSDIIAVMYNGKTGAILLDKSNKYWYKVSYNGSIGFVNKRYAVLSKKSQNENKRISSGNKFDQLRIGMTIDECRLLCGEPDKINRQVYSNREVEFWYYKSPRYTLHFRNGNLIMFSSNPK